jgi:hypothetical protein
MKTPSALLPIAFSLGLSSLAGCAFSDPTNGSSDNLTFTGPAASVVGEPVSFDVQHEEAALQLCGKSDCGNLIGGKASPIASVSAVGCDGDACTIDQSLDGSVVRLTVVGKRETSTSLNITVVLADGSHMSDSFPLRFLAATRIGTYCNGTCGGARAVFPGAILAWRLRAENVSDGNMTPLHTSLVDATVSGGAVKILNSPVDYGPGSDNEPASPYWALGLQAVAPGTSVVHLTAGGVTRDVTVRVASRDQIADAELHRDSTGDDPNYVDVDAPAPLLPFDSQIQNDEGHFSFVLIHLTDGSEAIGGAGYLSVTKPLDIWSDSTGANDDTTKLATGTFTLDAEGYGPGMVLFDLGTIHHAWKVDSIKQKL